MAQIVRQTPILRLLDRQTFTANGTWNKPADFAGNIAAGRGAVVRYKLIGGGAGGGCTSFGDTGGYVDGGEGGEVLRGEVGIEQTANTESVAVAASAPSGTAGNDTLFGALARAGGGRASRANSDGNGPFPNITGGSRAGHGGWINNIGNQSQRGGPGCDGSGDGGDGQADGGSAATGNPGAAPGGGGGAGTSAGGAGARGEATIEVWGY